MGERRGQLEGCSEQAVVETTSFSDQSRYERRNSGKRVRGPDAGFLSQLLALRAGMPSQRTKRRAEPLDGATAYRSSAQLGRKPEMGARLAIKA